MSKFPFEPDFVVAPGETIKEVLDHLNISNKEFANKLSLSEEMVEQLFEGKMLLTEDLANKISSITNIPLNMLLNLESNFQKDKQRKKRNGF